MDSKKSRRYKRKHQWLFLGGDMKSGFVFIL